MKIQDAVKVLNCKKCGERPVIEQRGKIWAVLCKKTECHNEVTGKYVDFEGWDNQNNNQ